MSYQTFYRKYRPSTLEDVSGQQAIVKIIKNSLELGRINHAYLFCGPRGTGKTTMARILAKSVNCLDLKDGIACGKCKNCLSISTGNCPDIIEMDAASNNGVDEIREIKNKVSLVPTELKYKVYVIDEVHMLSIGAFNALLKTLEEPPEHVIFILATTDLHKVPITIVSRCQCLDFQRIHEEKIVERLKYIVENEHIEIEDSILMSIANLSDGGFRDAIGMLDKLVSYSGNKVELSDFEELNGIVSLDEKKYFLSIVESGEVKNIVQFVDRIYNSGKDLIIFSQDLLVLCRDLIVDYYSYKKTDYNIDFLLQFVEKMNEVINALKNANNIRIIFETKILSFISKKNESDPHNSLVEESKVSNTKESYDKMVEQKSSAVETQKNIVKENQVQIEKYAKRNSIIVNNCFCNASKENLKHIKEQWEKLSDYALDSTFGAVACYLSDATVRAASNHEVIITFDYESVVTRGYQLWNSVEKLLYKLLGTVYNVAYLTVDQWNAEKKQYIENKNNGNSYVYHTLESLDEMETGATENDTGDKDIMNSSDNSIAEEAIKLFGENLVSVNE